MMIDLEQYEVEHLKDILRWRIQQELECAGGACTDADPGHAQIHVEEAILALDILGTLDWASRMDEVEEKPKAQLASVTPIGPDVAASPAGEPKSLDVPEKAAGPEA